MTRAKYKGMMKLPWLRKYNGYVIMKNWHVTLFCEDKKKNMLEKMRHKGLV